MIEILIVVVILAILLLIALFSVQKRLAKGRDAHRKKDIDILRQAFADYYNDHSQYPPANAIDNCGPPGPSDELYSYLKDIPCDPVTGNSYEYDLLDGDARLGYRLLTDLEVDTDPQIKRVGCEFEWDGGCTGAGSYDYGVAVGAPMADSRW